MTLNNPNAPRLTTITRCPHCGATVTNNHHDDSTLAVCGGEWGMK